MGEGLTNEGSVTVFEADADNDLIKLQETIKMQIEQSSDSSEAKELNVDFIDLATSKIDALSEAVVEKFGKKADIVGLALLLGGGALGVLTCMDMSAEAVKGMAYALEGIDYQWDEMSYISKIIIGYLTMEFGGKILDKIPGITKQQKSSQSSID